MTGVGWVLLYRGHPGGGHIGAASAITLGFAEEHPVPDGAARCLKIVAAAREVIPAGDVVVVAGLRLHVENGLHNVAPQLHSSKLSRLSRARKLNGLAPNLPDPAPPRPSGRRRLRRRP